MSSIALIFIISLAISADMESDLSNVNSNLVSLC